MRLFGTIACTIFGATLLTGCAGMQLQKAEQTGPKGTEFSNSLYSGYLDLSRSEFAEGDYEDSDFFANAALAAAGSASPPQPQAISSRRLPKDKVADLSGARDRLTKALAAGAAEKMPAKAANAQVMFDCWMQEQEENFQPKDIERCRGGFMTAMAEVEGGMKPVPVAAAAPAPTKAPAQKPTELRYSVYFPFNSVKPTPDSDVVLKTAAAAARKLEGAQIEYVGNTDTAGASNYNMNLSKRRIEAVIDAMKQQGVTANKVDIAAHGETKLPVPTADNVPNAMNRRVQIVIRK